jgi:hypothetical protein
MDSKVSQQTQWSLYSNIKYMSGGQRRDYKKLITYFSNLKKNYYVISFICHSSVNALYP